MLGTITSTMPKKVQLLLPGEPIQSMMQSKRKTSLGVIIAANQDILETHAGKFMVSWQNESQIRTKNPMVLQLLQTIRINLTVKLPCSTCSRLNGYKKCLAEIQTQPQLSLLDPLPKKVIFSLITMLINSGSQTTWQMTHLYYKIAVHVTIIIKSALPMGHFPSISDTLILQSIPLLPKLTCNLLC